jgi:pyridoxamine 5'-phosphate oxidase-like protein
MDPIAERLELPDGYGRVTTTLAWATVRAALEEAMHYWVTTVRPVGRPHAVPVDGLWLDDAWFYGGSEQAVHYRNALASPRVVMHLPDPAKAVVVEGDARLARPSPALARRLAKASHAKYGYGPDAQAYEGALGLYPRRVLAWSAFPRDATRFRFV